MTIGWVPPSDMGGCNLLTYELQINDGLGGDSFLGIDSGTLDGRPYLIQHTITVEATADPAVAGGPLVLGGAYKVKLLAYNEVGHTESTNYLEIVVASVPDPPPNAPTQDFTHTDEGQIRVGFGSLESATYNGGSKILGHDLWRDDGAGGDLSSLYGAAAAFQSNLALTFTDFDVVKGTTYRYMYRARNVNGWGDFSEVAYLFAASVPAQPRAPSLVSVDDDEISLRLYTSEDTGGNDLLAYELWIDAGDTNTAFSLVTSYSGSLSSLAHAVSASSDSLTPGLFYSFQFRSQNQVGYSEFSAITRIGLGAEPPAIDSLVSNLTACGPSFVAMAWDPISAPL